MHKRTSRAQPDGRDIHHNAAPALQVTLHDPIESVFPHGGWGACSP
ncbi:MULTISPECIES: hypothetical protein [unclassified Streptomyces]